jgi:hypothetical protein
MRVLLLIGVLLAMCLPAQAHQRLRQHVITLLSPNLTEPCRQAARMGGPCGCWAEEHFFGRSDHVLNGMNLWLADEWRRVFPHVRPAAGTAAIWPGRHVAPVVAYNGGSTVTVADSWGTHDVSIRGLVFVDPYSRYARAM